MYPVPRTTYLVSCASYLAPRTSYQAPRTPHHAPGTSHLISYSYLIHCLPVLFGFVTVLDTPPPHTQSFGLNNHTKCFAPRTSCLVPRTSYLAPRTMYLATRTSCLIPCTTYHVHMLGMPKKGTSIKFMKIWKHACIYKAELIIFV